MRAEVSNALFFTYLATEYGTAYHDSVGRTSRRKDWDVSSVDRKQNRQKVYRIALVVVVVLLVNICEDVTVIGYLVESVVSVFQILHVPKVVFVVCTYLAALYMDCRLAAKRNNRDKKLLFQTEFLPRVLRLFLRILPIYPMAAVLISFGFMFVIAVFEFLNVSVDSLDWPIYYGTLYGPFSYIYYVTKRDFFKQAQFCLFRALVTLLVDVLQGRILSQIDNYRSCTQRILDGQLPVTGAWPSMCHQRVLFGVLAFSVALHL